MAEKNEITVTITGHANVGKSTVTHLVIIALEEAGLSVNVAPEVYRDYGDEEKFIAAMETNFGNRIDAVEAKSSITVKEIQIHREKLLP